MKKASLKQLKTALKRFIKGLKKGLFLLDRIKKILSL